MGGGVERARARGLRVGAGLVDDVEPRLAVEGEFVGFGLGPVLGDQRAGAPVNVAGELVEVPARGVEDVRDREHLAGPERGGAGHKPGVDGGVGDDARGAAGERGDADRALVGLNGEGRDLQGDAGTAGAGVVGEDGRAGERAVGNRGLRRLAREREHRLLDGGQLRVTVGGAVLVDELELGGIVRTFPVHGLGVGRGQGEGAERNESEETAHEGYQSLPFFLGVDGLWSASIS